jgi:hypothetical protein
MKIATIINYCTSDYRFIKTCIDAVLPFSDQVIIPIADHTFDGQPENNGLVNKSIEENPNASFYYYEWKSGNSPRYWHNISRIIGVEQLNKDIDWVLFLDSDEIVETELFSKFIKTELTMDSYKIANYWYFREPIYRAKAIEDSAVLVRKELINIDPYNPYIEREQLCNNNNQRNTLQDGLPMIHHYSWVRTKEQMVKKVLTWAHSEDTLGNNWIDLIEDEFSREFNGTDFVWKYNYNIVENKFNL